MRCIGWDDREAAMTSARGGQAGIGDVGRTSPSDPRVVVFECGGHPRVEVVELPRVTTIGTRIRHRGTSWLVTGLRTHERVVFCRAIEA
jgi:hypothetical protein